MSWIHSIKWDSDGLVPVIAQDYKTNKVLMFAWMNQEALELTQKNKKAFYWSRSRKKIWEKGEESGHTQNVREIRLDCDGDVVLLKIEQVEISGKDVFKVAENSLYACFDMNIDEEFAKELASLKPLRVVFRDAGFKGDTAKTNVKQLLKQLSPDTEMKVI
jgi:phosphoribosyl-AMP cyclohydrolase